jgi:hypothetical protein
MIEKPAEGVKGFFLYNPFEKQPFFRVYGELNPITGRKSFTDYKICAEDIEVTIETNLVSLYEGENDENKLDWSSRVLGKESQ